MEARGLTFQRDRRYTRLAHLRDFELWPETGGTRSGRLAEVKWKDGGKAAAPADRERVAKEPANVVTCNVRLAREAALIISYPKLDFPPATRATSSLFPRPALPLQLPAYSGLSTGYETGITSGAAIFEDRRVYVPACVTSRAE